MNRTTVLMICMVLAGAVPAAADVKDQEKVSSEARTPHEELREAVAKIRLSYSPEEFSDAGYRVATGGRHARLGILLGGPWRYSARTEAGAVVLAVTPGSPADEAGLTAGDVITKFNDVDLVDTSRRNDIASMMASRRLMELSEGLENGDTVTLEYLRDGKTRRAVLTAREHEIDPVLIGKLSQTIGRGVASTGPLVHLGGGRWFLPRAWLDMELVALNPELGEYFGADGGVLVVRGPEKDDSLGLKSGDVILRIGEREVRNPEHAMRILRSYEPEEELTLHIIRRGRSETLTGTVPGSPIDFDFRFDSGDWMKPIDR